MIKHDHCPECLKLTGRADYPGRRSLPLPLLCDRRDCEMESTSGSQTYFSTALLVGVLGIMSFVLYQSLKGSKQSLPLPPGPRKLPVLGNAFDFPKSEPWVTFSKWGEQYGAFISSSIGFRTSDTHNEPAL